MSGMKGGRMDLEAIKAALADFDTQDFDYLAAAHCEQVELLFDNAKALVAEVDRLRKSENLMIYMQHVEKIDELEAEVEELEKRNNLRDLENRVWERIKKTKDEEKTT